MAQITLNSTGVASSGALALQSNGTTTALTIDASQNVGIGTVSPGFKLDVSGGNARMTSGASTADLLMVDTGTTSGNVRLRSESNAMKFITGNGISATIDSSGNLLVGATSAIVYGAFEKFTISNPSGNAAVLSAGGNTYPTLYIAHNYGSGTQTYLYFVYNGTGTGSITSTGSTTNYGSLSDYRLKENIQPLIGALSKVMQLNPVSYTWKASGESDDGFIAHELQEVCPSAVTGEKDAVDENGNPKYQGIDTSFLVATLTAAIKEQQTLITNLTDRITALEAK
jgi:hypothetical protein